MKKNKKQKIRQKELDITPGCVHITDEFKEWVNNDIPYLTKYIEKMLDGTISDSK